MGTFETIDSTLGSKPVKLVRASQGKRLTNYLVDYVAFMLVFMVIVFVFAFAGFEMLWLDNLSVVMDHILSAIFYVIFMTIQETLLDGKSLGKLITNTKVLMIDGNKPDNNTYFVRSICRAVPFDAFSFLGDKSNGWHDKWSKTMVIDIKESSY